MESFTQDSSYVVRYFYCQANLGYWIVENPNVVTPLLNAKMISILSTFQGEDIFYC